MRGTAWQRKRKPRKSQPKEVKKGPRQQHLPEMEDNKIAVLEDLALYYAEVRDERMGLSQQEVELKGKLLDLMKAQKKRALPSRQHQDRHCSREGKHQGQSEGRRGRRHRRQ